jgi:hypothetical protein
MENFNNPGVIVKYAEVDPWVDQRSGFLFDKDPVVGNNFDCNVQVLRMENGEIDDKINNSSVVEMMENDEPLRDAGQSSIHACITSTVVVTAATNNDTVGTTVNNDTVRMTVNNDTVGTTVVEGLPATGQPQRVRNPSKSFVPSMQGSKCSNAMTVIMEKLYGKTADQVIEFMGHELREAGEDHRPEVTGMCVVQLLLQSEQILRSLTSAKQNENEVNEDWIVLLGDKLRGNISEDDARSQMALTKAIAAVGYVKKKRNVTTTDIPDEHTMISWDKKKYCVIDRLQVKRVDVLYEITLDMYLEYFMIEEEAQDLVENLGGYWPSLQVGCWMHAVDLYMKFEEIPFPREKDILVMELIMERISSATAIQSLNRCRCYLSALFLSDITTADGKYLEQLAMIPCENGTKSRYKFPREAPTQADWKRWQRFWTEYTSRGNRLPVELGRWINPTHRTWRWFYIKETDDLQRLDKNKLYHYQRRAGRTRGTTSYDVTSTEEFKGQFLGTPTSVTTAFSEATVTKHNEGPLLVKGPKQPADFWQFLASWGGEWMWEGIDDNQITKHDLTWLVDGMKNKTVTWVTDGSYDKLRAADLSGIGWVLLCTRTGKRLTGWCWERSITANSYRAEMLGLCSLHLLARALSEYYKITNWEITICCDNEGALDCSSYQLRRIKPSAKCADIRRSFRSTKLGLSGKFRYEHVYGHMDDYLLWHHCRRYNK